MNEYLTALIRRHANTGVIIDSSLLLLFFIGTYRRSLIGRYKHLSAFADEDYETLIWLIQQFGTLFTTPNILTEVSNLSTALPENFRPNYFEVFASSVPLLSEEYVASGKAVAANHFRLFGLTDTVIGILARRNLLVLTTDLRLYHYLLGVGIDAMNFNEIRTLGWR